MLRKDDLHCGGAVVSKKHIVTAAHCVVDIETYKSPAPQFSKEVLKKEFKIILGANRYKNIANDRAKNFTIQMVKVHENYSYTDGIRGYFDVAVITLVTEIDFDPYRIQPICLPKYPSSKQDEWDRLSGVVVGYAHGEEKENPNVSITHMKIFSKKHCEADLKRISNHQAKLKFGHSFKRGVEDTMICAKNHFNLEATCKGDSGK